MLVAHPLHVIADLAELAGDDRVVEQMARLEAREAVVG